MVASINASTSAGVVTTADTSGILQLQTASTAAVTIDASQNVGIGTTSPTAKLDVSSNSAGVTAGDLVVDTANKTVYVGRQSSTGGDNSYLVVRGRVNGSGTNQAIAITGDTSAYGTGLFRPGNDILGFSTLATERMRIDSAGSVAIGSTSTASATRLTLKGSGTGSSTLLNCQDSGGTALLTLAENGNLSFNSGYGSNATAYGCRAWVNFNGTGTVAIRASGNVSSLTDNGTGDYTINFTNAMPDANYSAAMQLLQAAARLFYVNGLAAGSLRIVCINLSEIPQDNAYISATVFR
jgi:hypothetical protein